MNQTNLPTLLLACLTVECREETYAECTRLAPDVWTHLYELALAQRVLPLFWQRLSTHGLTPLLPPQTCQLMQEQYYEMAVNNMHLYQEAGVVLSRLRAQQLQVIVLKGAHLGSVVYANPALRQMTDVDLLFAQADIPAVADLFQELGYQGDEALLLDRHFATDHHLPRYAKPEGKASFEAHWLVTFPDKAYTIAIDELWARAQPVTIAGVDTLALCPEDLLLHICEHATYHHLLEQGIRFLCDIDAIVRRYEKVLDWAAIQTRATQWGWTKGVYLALTLAQRLLKTPIPADLLHQLAPQGVETVLVDQAIRQLFADQREVSTVSNEFAQMWGTQSLRQKIQLLGARLFAPERIVQRYPVRPGSWQLYLYYPIRCKDLLVRYGHTLWRLWRRDPLLTATTQSKHQLATWFEQK